jgi:hypothetical protein
MPSAATSKWSRTATNPNGELPAPRLQGRAGCGVLADNGAKPYAWLMRAVAFYAVLAMPVAAAASARHAAHSWTPVSLGKFGDWEAATHPEAGVAVCYAYTFAKSSKPALTGRGRVVLTIAQRPHERDAVAVSLGYQVLPHAGALVVANGVKLHFYLEGRSAFAPQGAAAIAAFHGGREAVGHFPGPGGVTLADEFSLNGFAGAYAVSLKACPP